MGKDQRSGKGNLNTSTGQWSGGSVSSGVTSSGGSSSGGGGSSGGSHTGMVLQGSGASAKWVPYSSYTAPYYSPTSLAPSTAHPQGSTPSYIFRQGGQVIASGVGIVPTTISGTLRTGQPITITTKPQVTTSTPIRTNIPEIQIMTPEQMAYIKDVTRYNPATDAALYGSSSTLGMDYNSQKYEEPKDTWYEKLAKGLDKKAEKSKNVYVGAAIGTIAEMTKAGLRGNVGATFSGMYIQDWNKYQQQQKELQNKIRKSQGLELSSPYVSNQIANELNNAKTQEEYDSLKSFYSRKGWEFSKDPLTGQDNFYNKKQKEISELSSQVEISKNKLGIIGGAVSGFSIAATESIPYFIPGIGWTYGGYQIAKGISNYDKQVRMNIVNKQVSTMMKASGGDYTLEEKKTILSKWKELTPGEKANLAATYGTNAVLIAGALAEGVLKSRGKVGGVFGEMETGLKYGSVKIKTLPTQAELNQLSGARRSIAEEATNRGGFVDGATGIEIQARRGTFREGVDLDIKFKNKEDVNSFAQRAFNIKKNEYINKGLNPNRLELKIGNKNNAKIVDNVLKKDVVDIGVRSKANVKIVNNVAVRDVESILKDKKGIVRVKDIDAVKKLKAQNDLKLWEKQFGPKEKTLWRGLYWQQGELKVKPLIGKAEKGFTGYGKFPEVDKILSMEGALYPKLASKNIASYPGKALEASFWRNPEYMKKIGISGEDIRLTQMVKEIQELRNIKKLNPGILAKNTEAIKNMKALEGVYAYLRKHGKWYSGVYKRGYGSAFEIAQRSPEWRRLIHDIEIEFASQSKALKAGEELTAILKRAGLKDATLIDDPAKGLGIYVKGDKAIELKYKGEEASLLELSSGFRYGAREYRGTTKLQGIKVQPWGEQMAVRKPATSATWWTDFTKKIGQEGRTIIEPPVHRAKDVVDVYASLKSGVKSGELPQKWETFANNWINRNWRNPEVKTLLAEYKQNPNAYLANMRTDITGFIKPQPISTEQILGTTAKVTSVGISKGMRYTTPSMNVNNVFGFGTERKYKETKIKLRTRNDMDVSNVLGTSPYKETKIKYPKIPSRGSSKGNYPSVANVLSFGSYPSVSPSKVSPSRVSSVSSILSPYPSSKSPYPKSPSPKYPSPYPSPYPSGSAYLYGYPSPYPPYVPPYIPTPSPKADFGDILTPTTYTRRKGGYAPSISAFELGKIAKRTPRKQTYSGIEIRPLIMGGGFGKVSRKVPSRRLNFAKPVYNKQVKMFSRKNDMGVSSILGGF